MRDRRSRTFHTMQKPHLLHWPVERATLAGFGLALLILFVIGVVSYRTTSQLIETAAWVNTTQIIMQDIASLRARMTEVENHARGFLITGSDEYPPLVEGSGAAAQQVLAKLEGIVSDPAQKARLATLRPLITRSLASTNELVSHRRTGGFDAARNHMAEISGKQLTTDIDSVLEEMTNSEYDLLRVREAAAKRSARRLIYTLIVGTSLAVLIVLLAGFFIRRGMTERKRAAQELQRSNEVLLKSVTELEQRTREIVKLGDMGDLLQSCQSVEEAYKVLGQKVPEIITVDAGALGIISPSRSLVEVVAVWGTHDPGDQVYAPDDCWALRRGRMNIVEGTESALRCKHFGEIVPAASLCVPLVAQGEALGVLTLIGSGFGVDGRTRLTPARQRLIGTVADRVALAIANLRLRAALMHQSVRDPLTGLFNRRYMEESLERELRRAARGERPLGVLMLDLDYFKHFNDTFGHDAGDTMLREFSNMLRSNVRGGDIACRYGGEEFALILPEASLEVTRQRAELLREKAKHLGVEHKGTSLGSITISGGVAAFPDNGNSSEKLLEAADSALYAAKSAGRDRIVVAKSRFS